MAYVVCGQIIALYISRRVNGYHCVKSFRVTNPEYMATEAFRDQMALYHANVFLICALSYGNDPYSVILYIPYALILR